MSSSSFDWSAPCRGGDSGMTGYFLNRSLYGSGVLSPDSHYFPRLRDQAHILQAGEDAEASAHTIGDAMISSISRRCCLSDHTGCVNSIEYSPDCSLLVTGSDDRQVCIYDARDQFKLLTAVPTAHQQNIFSAQIMPETANRRMISSGLDGAVIVTDTETLQSTTILRERFTMASKVLPIGGGCHCPFSTFSPSVAVSIFDDGNLHFIDTRDMKVQLTRQFRKIPLTASLSPPPLTLNCIVQHPHNSNIIAVGTDESYVSLCDLRYLSTDSGEPAFRGRGGFLNISTLRHRDGKKGVGGVNFSEKGDRLLINYKDAPLYCVDWVSHMGSSHVSTDNMSKSTLMNLAGITSFLPSEKPPTVDKSKKVRGYFARVMGGDEDEDESGTDEEEDDGMETAFSRNVLTDPNGLRMSERQNMITMFKEPTFLLDDKFIATGSDDGFVYFWEATTGILVHRTQLDADIVNGVLYHPSHPNTLITCGIDKDVKIAQIHPVYSHSNEANEPFRSRNLIGDKRPRDHPLFQQTLFISTASNNHKICKAWSQALEERAKYKDDHWAPVPGVLKTTLLAEGDRIRSAFPAEVLAMTQSEATVNLFDLMGRGGYSDPIVKHALLQWMFTQLLSVTNLPKRQRILFALGVHMPILSFREKSQILRRFDVTGEVLSTMPILPLSMRPKQGDDPEVNSDYSLFGLWGVVCNSDAPPTAQPMRDVGDDESLHDDDEFYDDAGEDGDDWMDGGEEEGEEEEGEWMDSDDWGDDENEALEGGELDHLRGLFEQDRSDQDDESDDEGFSEESDSEGDGDDGPGPKIIGRLAVVQKEAVMPLPPVSLSRLAEVPSEFFPSYEPFEAFSAFGLNEDVMTAFSAGGIRYALPFSCAAPFLSDETEYIDSPAVRALVQVGSRAEALSTCLDYWLSPSRGPILLTHAELLFLEHQITMLRSSIRTPLLTDVRPSKPFAYLSKERKKTFSNGDTLGAMEGHMALVHDMNQLLMNPLCANITGDIGAVMERTALLLKVPGHAYQGFEDGEPVDALGRSVAVVRRFLRHMSPLVVFQPDKEVADARSRVTDSALTPARRVDGRYTTSHGKKASAASSRPESYMVPVERVPGQLFDFKKCKSAASTSTPAFLVANHGKPLRTNSDIQASLDEWDSRRPTTKEVGGVAGEVMRADPKACISRHSRESILLSRDIYHATLSTPKKPTAAAAAPKKGKKTSSSHKAETDESAASAGMTSIQGCELSPHHASYIQHIPFASRLPQDFGYLHRFCVAQEIRFLVLGYLETQTQLCFGGALHTRFKTTLKAQATFVNRLQYLRNTHPEVRMLVPQVMITEALAQIKNKNATTTPAVEECTPIEPILDGDGPNYSMYFTDEEKRLFGTDEWMDVARYRAIIMNRSPLFFCDTYNGIDRPRTYIPLAVEQYRTQLNQLYKKHPDALGMPSLTKIANKKDLDELFKVQADGADNDEAAPAKGKKKKAAKAPKTYMVARDPPPRNGFEQLMFEKLREDYEDPTKKYIYDFCGYLGNYGSTGNDTHHIHSVIASELLSGVGFPQSSTKSVIRGAQLPSYLFWSAVDSGVHPLAFVMTPDEVQETSNPAIQAVRDAAAHMIQSCTSPGKARDDNIKLMEKDVYSSTIPTDLYKDHRPPDDLKNWVRYSQVMEQAVCNLETLIWAMYRILIIMKERDGIEVELAWDKVKAKAVPEVPRLTEAALRELEKRRAHDKEYDDDADGGLRQIRMRSYCPKGGFLDYEPPWADTGHPSNGSTATSNFVCDQHCRTDLHETDEPTQIHIDSAEISQYYRYQHETEAAFGSSAFDEASIDFTNYYEVKQLMDLVAVFEGYVPFLLKPLGSAQRSTRVTVAYEQFAQIKAAVGKLLGIQAPCDVEHVGKFISSLNVTGFSVPSDPNCEFDLPTSRPAINPHSPSTPASDPALTPSFHPFFAYSSRYIIPALQLLETVLKVTNNGTDVDDDDDSALALKTIPTLINTMLEGIPTGHPIRREAAKQIQPYRHLIPRIDL